MGQSARAEGDRKANGARRVSVGLLQARDYGKPPIALNHSINPHDAGSSNVFVFGQVIVMTSLALLTGPGGPSSPKESYQTEPSTYYKLRGDL